MVNDDYRNNKCFGNIQFGVKTTACFCDKDLCNSSSFLAMSTLAMFGTIYAYFIFNQQALSFWCYMFILVIFILQHTTNTSPNFNKKLKYRFFFHRKYVLNKSCSSVLVLFYTYLFSYYNARYLPTYNLHYIATASINTYFEFLHLTPTSSCHYCFEWTHVNCILSRLGT